MEVSNSFLPKDMTKTFEVFLNKTPLKTVISYDNKKLKDDKFEKKYGMLYTGAATLSGIGILFLLIKGGKLSGLNKFIQKHYTELSAKTAEAKNNIHNMDLFERIKYKISSLVVSTTKRTQAIGNINPIKDIAFDRFTKFIHVKPFFDKITQFFTNLSKNLTAKKYNAPRKSLINFKKELHNIITVMKKSNHPNAEIFAKKLEELSAKSSSELNSIVNGFEERFSNVLSTLNKPVEIKLGNTSIRRTSIENQFLQEPMENLFAGFIPAKTIYPIKKKLFEGLFINKQKLSNSVIDVSKALDSLVDDIFKNAPMEKTDIRKSYLSLKELIKTFENPKNYKIAHRSEIKPKLINALDGATQYFNEKSPQRAMISDLKKLITEDKRGAIEEIISLCKQFGLKESNPKLYRQLLAKRDRFQNKLNEAIKFETENTFGKMLDYSLHSLPTDMMTQAIGMGSLLYILLNRSKSKDEKISSTLKSGIPIIGGLGVMFACNVRQVASGPSALFLGFLSTLILNRLGKVADVQYLAYKNNKSKLAAKQNTAVA